MLNFPPFWRHKDNKKNTSKVLKSVYYPFLMHSIHKFSNQKEKKKTYVDRHSSISFYVCLSIWDYLWIESKLMIYYFTLSIYQSVYLFIYLFVIICRFICIYISIYSSIYSSMVVQVCFEKIDKSTNLFSNNVIL